MSFDLRDGLPLSVIILLVLMLGACGSSRDPQVAYRGAESSRPLEMPPDLVRRDATRDQAGSGALDGDMIGDAEAANGAILPDYAGVEWVRAGSTTWLEVADTSPDWIWEQVIEFFRTEGIEIARRHPALGIVETGWVRRDDGARDGGIVAAVASLFTRFTGSPMRDRYQVRLERMDADGGTRIFVTHWHVQEDGGSGGGRAGTYGPEWTDRGGDPAIEAEMKRRLLVHLGIARERVDMMLADDAVREALPIAARYEETDGGVASVVVGDPSFRRVWARTGDVLDRLGATVTRADSGAGRYELTWLAPDVEGGRRLFGLLGRADPEPRDFHLQFRSAEEGIRITAGEAAGDVAARADTPTLRGLPRSADEEKSLLRHVARGFGAELPERERDGAEPETERAGPARRAPDRQDRGRRGPVF